MNLIIAPTVNKSYEFINGAYAQVSTTLYMVYVETNGQREMLISKLYKTEEEARIVGTALLQSRVKSAPVTTAPRTSHSIVRKCPRCGRTQGQVNFTTCPPYCDDCA